MKYFILIVLFQTFLQSEQAPVEQNENLPKEMSMRSDIIFSAFGKPTSPQRLEDKYKDYEMYLLAKEDTDVNVPQTKTRDNAVQVEVIKREAKNENFYKIYNRRDGKKWPIVDHDIRPHNSKKGDKHQDLAKREATTNRDIFHNLLKPKDSSIRTKREAQNRRTNMFNRPVRKPHGNFNDKHVDYDLHVLGRRGEENEEEVISIENSSEQRTKRAAQNRRTNMFNRRVRKPHGNFNDKHVDYDLHLLGRRGEESEEEVISIENSSEQRTKRAAQNRRTNMFNRRVRKPHGNFNDKHVDYDLHLLGRRGEESEEEVIPIENSSEQRTKRAAQNRRTNMFIRPVRKPHGNFNDKHVDYDLHVLGRRHEESDEEANNVESKNKM